MQLISQVLKASVCGSYLALALKAESQCHSVPGTVPVGRLVARLCAPAIQIVRATAIWYKAICLQKAYQIPDHYLLKNI